MNLVYSCIRANSYNFTKSLNNDRPFKTFGVLWKEVKITLISTVYDSKDIKGRGNLVSISVSIGE